MKLELNDLKTVIVVVGATVAAMVYFVPDKVFRAETTEIVKQVGENTARLNGIDVAYLQKRLDYLKAKYGHTSCYSMPDPDKGECLWLKDALARFGK